MSLRCRAVKLSARAFAPALPPLDANATRSSADSDAIRILPPILPEREAISRKRSGSAVTRFCLLDFTIPVYAKKCV
jgi:hypothetical protein